MSIGFWLADREGRLLLGNPAGERIWGAQHHGGQEEYGIFKAWRLPGRERIRPDDWALGYAVNEGRTTTEELLQIEALDGTHKFILNWAAPVKKEDGKIISAFVINQDLTDRVLAKRSHQCRVCSIGTLKVGKTSSCSRCRHTTATVRC